MSWLPMTADEVLRAQGHADVDWDNFHSNHKDLSEETEVASIPADREITHNDDFDDMRHGHHRREGERLPDTPRLGLSSQNTSSERLDESDSQCSSGKLGKRGKTKKTRPGFSLKPSPLNVYQDQLREELQFSHHQKLPLHNHDTMSDEEVKRRQGARRLHRRGQMKKYRSLEHSVEQAGRDILEQKFMELEELMSRPLLDTGHHRAHMAPQSLKQNHVPPQHRARSSKKQQLLGRQNGDAAGLKNEEAEADSWLRAWVSSSTLDDAETTDRLAYSPLHGLHTTAPGPHTTNHQAASMHENYLHQSHHNSRLTSKPPVPRQQGKITKDKVAPDTASKKSHLNYEAEGQQQENRLDQLITDGKGEDDRFGNVSPRSVYVPVEMHLKYTNNPKLQEWLRQKNLEFHQAKKAERAKKKEARLQKQAEVKKKAAQREKSCECVKQWMAMKQKEAICQQKEVRRRRKLENQEQATLRAQNDDGRNKGRCLDRPKSAPAAKKQYVPIKRPESAARLENGAYMAPKPPDTKFVYKRPVSGRVRLMKVQNDKNAKGSGSIEQTEELSPEEKEKKMRISYDAWLIAKRKEDGDKRREAKKQEALIKSDPEMDRLVPELAVRRIQHISNGKKSIDTGISVIDNDVSRRFGGGSFGKEEGVHQKHDSVPEPSSYNLTWELSGTTLTELNSRARPTVAKTRMPIPQSTLSPRQPQWAKAARDSSPKVKAVMEQDLDAEPNPFVLPFSSSFAVSLHTQGTKMNISSKRTSLQIGNSLRPEPQGCASVEPASCLKGVYMDSSHKPESFPRGVDSSHKPESTTTSRSSLVLLQQIEAAALQSEQPKGKHWEQKVDQGTYTSTKVRRATSGDQLHSIGLDGQLSGTSSEEPPQQLFITEPAEYTNEDKGVQNRAGDEAQQEQKQDNATQEKCTEHQGEEQEPESVKEKPIPAGAVVSNSMDAGEQPPERQARSADCGDITVNPEVKQQDSAVSKAEGCGMTEGDSQQGQAAPVVQDSPGRSMKHVSFSEDLTTVFQASSPETSSNFDDEREMDGEEGEDPYMSLDQVPDPE